jgi:hypothetical protein
MPLPRREHEYVNDIVINSNRDVFDMREYHSASLWWRLIGQYRELTVDI